ncbi:TrbI/VirB10 family protein [Acidiphilium acidophilum]|uniref:TrbI/VirB10 family protein n=1 Tax=Acidiphilium acidophilum TaxID=76588 RepID=UPI002E8E6628|nr:TrbI/VirB10 family protein [Acidiphilium acidophilum]
MDFLNKFGIGKGGKDAPDPSAGDTGAPNGLHSKPDGGVAAVVLNRKPMLIGCGLLVLASAGAYAAFSMIDSGKEKATAEAVTPGHAVHVSLPAGTPHRPKPPATGPATPTKAAAAMKTGFTGHRQDHRTASATPKQTPQEKAVLAALGGHQGSSAWNVGTQQNGKAAPAVTAQAGKKTSGESGAGVYDSHLVRRPASPYELMQGSVIQAVLTTAINSDLSGQVTAQISKNVWDSESGAYLLIPAGAKLVGIYSNKVIAGQTRVGVDWTRIVMPNGSYVSLGAMPGASPSGKDGFHDQVNDHTWEIFKNALLMSVVDLGISISQPGYGSAGGYGQQAITPAQTGEQSLAQTFGQAEANLLQRYTNVAPTLVIRAGYQMNVSVTKDIVFPGPYKAAPAYRGPVAPSGIAPATVMNPYPAQGN